MRNYEYCSKCLAINDLIAEYKDSYKVDITLEEFKLYAKEFKLNKLKYLIDNYSTSVYLGRLSQELMLYHLHRGFSRILIDMILNNERIEYIHTTDSNRKLEYIANNFNSFRRDLYAIIKYSKDVDLDITVENARINPQVTMPIYNGLYQNLIDSNSLLYVFLNYLDTDSFVEFYGKVLEIMDN